jgi:hypothetical protein
VNYYGARELRDADGKGIGRYHYTCRNDNRIWPVGYCVEHEGHATEQEAQDCYKRYLLDHRLNLDMTMNDTQRKCCICGEWTQKAAEIDNGQIWDLCDAHRNRETVEKLFSVGESISSY